MGYRGNFFKGKLQTKNADYTLLYSHRRAKNEKTYFKILPLEVIRYQN